MFSMSRFGFWVSGFGFRVLSFGFWVLGFRSVVSFFSGSEWIEGLVTEYMIATFADYFGDVKA